MINFVEPTNLKKLMHKLNIKETEQAVDSNLVKEVSDAVDTAMKYKIAPSDTSLKVKESMALAQWLVEDSKREELHSTKRKRTYVKQILQKNYRGAFSFFVRYYLLHFGENHPLDRAIEKLLHYYFNTFKDNQPIKQWETHKKLFDKTKGREYLQELFEEVDYNVVMLSEKYIPLPISVLEGSGLLKQAIVDIFINDRRSYENKLKLLPSIFGETIDNGRFTSILGGAVSPILEFLEYTTDIGIRKRVRNYFWHRIGNPRILTNHTIKLVWYDISELGRRQILRLFAQDDLDFFFSVVSSIEDSHMWRDRKYFWEQFVDYMDETYVYFSNKEQYQVNRYCNQYRSDNDIEGLEYNWVVSAGKKCAFIFRIRNYWIIEWSSSGYVYIYSADKEHPKNVFERFGHREDSVKRYFDAENEWQKKHQGNWEGPVEDKIRELTNV